MRGIFQPHHPASAVVVADHADESDDGSGRLMAHQILVLGEERSAGRSARRAGPASSLVVFAGELVERVVEHVGKHPKAVAHPAG